MEPKRSEAVDAIYSVLSSIARIPLQVAAREEPDDNDEICGLCGEAPKDCPGHEEMATIYE